jgi:hypothetical protein
MKRNQFNSNYNFSLKVTNNSFLKILRRFFTAKETFIDDLFPCLKAENEKLQIVFENIRV